MLLHGWLDDVLQLPKQEPGPKCSVSHRLETATILRREILHDSYHAAAMPGAGG